MNNMDFMNCKKKRQGDQVEQLFIQLVKEKRPDAIIITANTEQNRFEHWDYVVNGVKVDVKAIKDCGQDSTNYTIIEFLDVQMQKGWLYGSADIIAFQSGTTDNYIFLLTPRKALIDYCKHNVQTKTVSTLSEAINKLYSRTNDLVTVVNMDYLVGISKILKK